MDKFDEAAKSWSDSDWRVLCDYVDRTKLAAHFRKHCRPEAHAVNTKSDEAANEKLREFVQAQITETCLKNHVHHHNACVSCEARRVLYGVHDDWTHSTPAFDAAKGE